MSAGAILDRRNARLESWKRETLKVAAAEVERAAAAYPAYPPALKPVAVAQFLLESAWGKSDAGGARNFFGIKARDGEPFVERQTWEVVKGQDVRVAARFRKFASMAECFAAHARLICERTRGGRKIYHQALAHSNDPIRFAHALTGVYATDPQYGAKLERVMRDRGLLEAFGFPEGT